MDCDELSKTVHYIQMTQFIDEKIVGMQAHENLKKVHVSLMDDLRMLVKNLTWSGNEPNKSVHTRWKRKQNEGKHVLTISRSVGPLFCKQQKSVSL